MSGVQQKKAARSGKRGRSVRKRTDGSPRLVGPGKPGNPYPLHWAIAWTDRRDGKSRSRVVTTNEIEEARARDALIVFNAERSRPPEQRDITVNKICDAYVAAKAGEVRSHGSLESALQPIRRAFGPLRPDEVQATNLSSYVTDRAKEKRRRWRAGEVVEVDGFVSRKTIKNELIMFKTACAWAISEGWKIDMPPFKKQKGAARPRKRTLTRREFGIVMRALADKERTPRHLCTFINIALLTGQRSGAIRALKWEHIDFEDGMIWFTRANPDAPDNKRVQDHPMTDDLRAVLLDAQQHAVEARAKAAKRGHPTNEPEYVIEFKQRPVGSLKTAWGAFRIGVGIPDLWIHDLRRTLATFTRNRGQSLSDVALYLNDSEEVTERHYAHADPALFLPMQKAIAAVMVELAQETEPQDPLSVPSA